MKKTAKRTVRASDRAAGDFVSELGGRKTRASGSGLEKGDGRVPGKFRTETKCPPTGRYRITLAEWNKVYDAAISGGEVALMHLKLHDVELIVLRLQDFIAFGGEVGDRTFDLGIQRGHLLSKKLWMKTVEHGPHLRLALTSGPPNEIERHFVAMDRTDFIKLVEPTS